jgi:hypothetical protein
MNFSESNSVFFQSIRLGGNFGKPSSKIGINFRPIFCLLFSEFFTSMAPAPNDYLSLWILKEVLLNLKQKQKKTQNKRQVCNFPDYLAHSLQTKRKETQTKTFNPKSWT